jgi:hypothetical protein
MRTLHSRRVPATLHPLRAFLVGALVVPMLLALALVLAPAVLAVLGHAGT